jgi:hypothetical protein
VTSRRWALSGQRLRLAEAKEPPPAEFGWSVLGLKRGNGLRIESFDDEPDAKENSKNATGSALSPAKELCCPMASNGTAR